MADVMERPHHGKLYSRNLMALSGMTVLANLGLTGVARVAVIGENIQIAGAPTRQRPRRSPGPRYTAGGIP